MLIDTTNALSAKKEMSKNAGSIQRVYLAANGPKNDINKEQGHVSPLHAFAVILATRTEVFSDNEKV